MLRRPKSGRRPSFSRLPPIRIEMTIALRGKQASCVAALSAPVQSADLIAKGITQVSEVEFCGTALAPPGRVLNALSAVRYARVVESFDLVRAVAGEPYG